MSFLERKPSKKNKSALSLQRRLYIYNDTHRFKLIFPEISFKIPQTHRNSFSKRMSPGIFFHQTNKGSMTIEAALLLPIFIFAVISILSFTEILRVQMKIDSSLQQTAKELSIYAYAIKENVHDTNNALSFPAEAAFSETYIRARVLKELTGDYLKNSPVKEQGRLSFVGSKIMENDRIELRCTYSVTPFFALSKKAGFLTESVAVARAFTGYDNLRVTGADRTEKMVYVTQTGTAYHSSRSCNFLDLSIQMIDVNDVAVRKNLSGSHYYACPLCAKDGMGNVTYITNYGECFHYDLLCRGLKRTVYAIPISEVGGRRPCSKCNVR